MWGFGWLPNRVCSCLPWPPASVALEAPYYRETSCLTQGFSSLEVRLPWLWGIQMPSRVERDRQIKWVRHGQEVRQGETHWFKSQPLLRKVYSFWNLVIYFYFIWKADRERETEIFYLLDYFQTSTTPRAGLGQNQEPGISARSTRWMAQIWDLEPLAAASQGEHEQKAKLEAHELGFEQGTLIWDVGVPSSNSIAAPKANF